MAGDLGHRRRERRAAMPCVILSPGAFRDLQRLREFLRPKSPEAAQRAAKVIIKAIQVLGLQPGIGRPAEDLGPECRELPIYFGSSRLPGALSVQRR